MRNRKRIIIFLITLAGLSCIILVYQFNNAGTQKSVLLERTLMETDSLAFVKQTFVYKTVEGHSIKADVYRSPGKSIQPVIFWIHGGALIFGERGWMRPGSDLFKGYMRSGYTIVSIDYRLAPETKLAAIIEDVQDAYKWVRNEGPALFHIDPNRIVVIGHSAGGYLTLMAGFCFDPPPNVLVSFYGYGDIAGEWYSCPDSFYNQQPAISKMEAYEAIQDSIISTCPWDSNPDSYPMKRYLYYLYCRQNGLWPKEVSGFDPEKEPKKFDPWCPIRNITKDYPPTLLLHGDKDTDVPFEQSVMMAAELERHAVEYEFIRMENMGHGFESSGDGMKNVKVADAFKRVLDFMDKHNNR